MKKRLSPTRQPFFVAGYFRLVRFTRVIGQVAGRLHCGCPIHSGYRTSSRTVALWLSDSFGLSDKQQDGCIVVVRFIRVIGQAAGRLLVRFFAFFCPLAGHSSNERAFGQKSSALNCCSTDFWKCEDKNQGVLHNNEPFLIFLWRYTSWVITKRSIKQPIG